MIDTTKCRTVTMTVAALEVASTTWHTKKFKIRVIKWNISSIICLYNITKTIGIPWCGLKFWIGIYNIWTKQRYNETSELVSPVFVSSVTRPRQGQPKMS